MEIWKFNHTRVNEANRDGDQPHPLRDSDTFIQKRSHPARV